MKNIDKIIKILKKDTKDFVIPSVTELSEKKDITPYMILVSTLLSLRTKDEITYEVSKRLFDIAKTPEELLEIPIKRLEKIIFKTGFYHNKARTLREVSKEIIENYSGKVPSTIDELTSLKGVGRKTANLVVIKGFDKPGICVDTHVHRISNRLGLVQTKNADKTELALRKDLPKKYWMEINDLLVKYGQNVCRPISPHCKECRLTTYCKFFKENKK
ncbi:MAG: endonuclease III [Candidatus Muiribacterium halophilum]|uniref:Endonuclease III n=1 Tax=Muiribacterium halophilum TaxID=2053465 RepID=A0A2N5ZN18_MUIH1|nr:MAG: endonuclease III [Candidatus Muirbacterium halophilum]